MNFLSPISVAEAGEQMAGAMGLEWPKDRVELLRYINLYRSLLYSAYRQLPIFDTVYLCLCLHRLRPLCDEGVCSTERWGITLPPEVAGVVAAWRYDAPMRLMSHWKEVHDGRNAAAARHPLGMTDTGVTTPTEREVQAITTMKVWTESAGDAGKELVIDVRDADGKQRRISFSLLADAWAVSDLEVKDILSVVLPANMDGSITLAQADGYELSVYAPSDSKVPRFRQMAVGNGCGCNGGNILVQGTRAYQKVYFDTDVVEVGDPMAISLAGAYYRYWQSKDREEQVRAITSKGELMSTLAGMAERYRGRMIQDGVITSQRINTRGMLSNTSGGRRGYF